MEFSRQEYWDGLPFPSPGDLPDSGIEPGSPALRADDLPSEPPGNPYGFLENPILILKVSECNTQNKVRVFLPPEEKDRQSMGCPGKFCFESSRPVPGTSRALGVDDVVSVPRLILSPVCMPALCSPLGRETPGGRGSRRPHWTLGWELISVPDLSPHPQGRAGVSLCSVSSPGPRVAHGVT